MASSSSSVSTFSSEMDCLNIMDLLGPSQMNSSPESPEAFGSPTRSSSNVESITAVGHSSSATSGSLLGPISLTLGNKIYQPGTAACIPDFGFTPPSAHGDTSILRQVSGPPSFNPSRAPCPRSSVVPASGAFDSLSLDLGGAAPKFAGFELAQRSTQGVPYTAPQVSGPLPFHSSSTPCPGSSIIAALGGSGAVPKFAGFEFAQTSTHCNAYTTPRDSRPHPFSSSSTRPRSSLMAALGATDFKFAQTPMRGDANTTPQVSRPPVFNSSSTPYPGSSFVPAFRASGTLSLGFGCAPALSPPSFTVEPEDNQCARVIRHRPGTTTVFPEFSSDIDGWGALSLTFGPNSRAQCPSFGTKPTYLASDYAFGASGTVVLHFGSIPASNQSYSSSVVSSFGITPSISKNQSSNTAEFPWALDAAFGQSPSGGLLGNTVVSCSRTHEAELGNVTRERESISEMCVDRSKRRREDNYFIDEGGTTKQPRWSFGTRKPLFERYPLWSTEENCRGTPKANSDIFMQPSGSPDLTLEKPVHKGKSHEELRCVDKHAPSLDSANPESAKAFVSTTPSQEQTLFTEAFHSLFSLPSTQSTGNLFSSNFTSSPHSTHTLVGSGQTTPAQAAETSAIASFGQTPAGSSGFDVMTSQDTVGEIATSANATDMQVEPCTNRESSDAAVDAKPM